MGPNSKRWSFRSIANGTSRVAGQPVSFGVAVGIIVVWGLTGPLFGFSDTWQLVVNTGTTVITFLMVFLIQNSQNRDAEALQIKLDELIRATEGAHNSLLDLEEMEEQELDFIRARYKELAAQSRQRMESGLSDTEIGELREAEPK